MNKNQLIELLALSLAGLQAPMSMGMALLGTAEAPLREIMGIAPGWATAEEYEEIFAEILK